MNILDTFDFSNLCYYIEFGGMGNCHPYVYELQTVKEFCHNKHLMIHKMFYPCLHFAIPFGYVFQVSLRWRKMFRIIFEGSNHGSKLHHFLLQ